MALCFYNTVAAYRLFSVCILCTKSSNTEIEKEINSTNGHILIMKTRDGRCFTISVFEVLVEPAEELAVPYHRVLWLEYLMALVLELYEAGVETL